MISTKKIIILALIIVIYSILIVVSDVQKIIQLFSEIRLNYFLSFIGLFSLGVLFKTFRWHLFMRDISSTIPFTKNVLYYLSGFSMLITPGRVGEIIRSPFIKRDYGISISKTASIVFIERFYDLLAVVAIVSFTIPFTDLPKILLIIPISLTIFLTILIIKKSILIKLANNLRQYKILKNFIPDMEESYEVVRSLLKARIFSLGFIFSLTAVILEAISIFILFQSLNTSIDLYVLTAIYHTANFLTAISLIPGGLGVLEVGFSSLLILYDVPNEIAVLASLLIRISFTGLFSLIGIICLKIISKSH